MINANGKPRPALAALSLVVLVLAFGCASTEKRYRKGLELESKGRLEEAAQRYIAVLAKEPGRTDARDRLAEVGAELVAKYLGDARADTAEGRPQEAVDRIVFIDGLRERAGQVGVALSVPDDYPDFRRGTVDAAAEDLFRRGEDLERAGRWPDAARTYEKLGTYPLTGEQALRADEARARAFLRWAEQDMSLGAFRAAYGHAQTAMDVLGPDSPAGARSRALQKAALDAGTMTVAVLPFWADAGPGEAPPRGLEAALYDTLLYERMDEPPLFVGPIDRGEIHREMVRLRVRSGAIPDRTAALVGQALRADFVVTGWIDTYRQEDGAPEEVARKAVVRRDPKTPVTYVEKRYAVKLTAGVVLRIVDPVTRKLLDEETVTAQASATFRRASYDGDYRNLDLDRDERALFDRESWLRAEEDLQKKLADRLAERIAPALFDRVLRFVR